METKTKKRKKKFQFQCDNIICTFRFLFGSAIDRLKVIYLSNASVKIVSFDFRFLFYYCHKRKINCYLIGRIQHDINENEWCNWFSTLFLCAFNMVFAFCHSMNYRIFRFVWMKKKKVEIHSLPISRCPFNLLINIFSIP